MEKNQEQLNKLSKIFNSDKIVTTEDIVEVLQGIKSVIESFKKGNEELNSSTKQEVENLYSQIQEAHEQIMSEVSDGNTQMKDSVMRDFEFKIKELESIIAEVSTKIPVDGNDGKDADEEKIVEEVLAKIKLPEQKEVILDDGIQIVEKINTSDVKIKGDKIDLSNLEKDIKDVRGIAVANSLPQTTSFINGKRAKNLNFTGATVSHIGDTANIAITGGGGGGGHTIQDEGTPLTQRTNLNFVGSGVVATDDAGNDATIITIGGGGSTAWGDITGTLSDQTDLQSALNAITPNATHTGEVTGATDLTLHLKAIENRTDTDVAPDDYFLFLDATDTTLKKDTIQGILDLVSGGSGDVSKVGTPVDNQVGVWTGDGTIEGTSGLVFSSNALGIGGVGNVGAYSGSVATVRGSNSNIFEMIRDITSSDSLLGRFVAGNTSNSVSSSIDFRSGTVNNRGQIRLMTSNGTTNTEALRIDEAQKSTFYNGGVNLDYSTASRVPVLDASKNLIASSVTSTELGYVSGVTSAIQTQLDAKLASSAYDDATSAETNTGTSTSKYVSPDGLAGSYAGTKSIPVVVLHHDYLLTTGDGKLIFPIPDEFAGMNLVSVAMNVNTTSSSGNPSVQIARGRQSSATSAHTFADILTTNLTIDATEYDSKDATTPAVIGATNDDVAIGDLYRVDVDAKGTGTKGLSIRFGFRLP